MKRLSLFLLIVSFLATLIACSTDKMSGDFEKETKLVTLSAVIQNPDSKALVSDDGSFTWSAGDEIGVYTSEGSFACFTLKAGEEGKATAEFSALLEDGVSVVGPAVYPYNASHSYNPGTKTISFLVNPTSSFAWEQDNVKCPMVADYSGSGTISFSQVGGIMRITVFNVSSSFAYMRLSSFNSGISGSYNINLDAPILSSEASGSRSDITYSITADNALGLSYTYDFPLPTGTYNNFRLAGYTSEWGMTEIKTSTSSSNVIDKGTLLIMPYLWCGTSYNLYDVESTELGAASLPENLVSDSSYPGTQLEAVANPLRSPANPSSKVLKENMSSWSNASGYFHLDTHTSYYSSVPNFRSGAKGFRMSVLYNNPGEATMYCPWVDIKGPNTDRQLPDVINGKAFSPKNEETWAALIKPDDWNILQWNADCSGAYDIFLRPLLAFDGTQKAEGSKIIYLDNFEYVK